MIKIGRYGYSFGPVFWLQTQMPTRVKHFLWFWFTKEARPDDVDKKPQFSISTEMKYEGRRYMYWGAKKDTPEGTVVFMDKEGG